MTEPDAVDVWAAGMASVLDELEEMDSEAVDGDRLAAVQARVDQLNALGRDLFEKEK